MRFKNIKQSMKNTEMKKRKTKNEISALREKGMHQHFSGKENRNGFCLQHFSACQLEFLYKQSKK